MLNSNNFVTVCLVLDDCFVTNCQQLKVDKYSIVFMPKLKTRQTVQLIGITNASDKRLLCELRMDPKECYLNSRYSFEFHPQEFTLDKVCTRRRRRRRRRRRVSFTSLLLLP